MRIDVARLEEGGESFSGDDPLAILELEGDPLVEPAGPLHYDLFAVLVSGELLVHGALSIPVRCRCSRCTGRFDSCVRDPRFEAVVEVSEDTEFVDLTPEMRESILLAFPSYPICREECRGLCAQCGANLNEQQCACKPPEEGRWGVLEKLDL